MCPSRKNPKPVKDAQLTNGELDSFLQLDLEGLKEFLASFLHLDTKKVEEELEEWLLSLFSEVVPTSQTPMDPSPSTQKTPPGDS